MKSFRPSTTSRPARRRAPLRAALRAALPLAVLLSAGAGVLGALLPAPLAAQQPDSSAQARERRRAKDEARRQRAREKARTKAAERAQRTTRAVGAECEDCGATAIDTTVALAAGADVELSLVRGTIVVTSWDRREARVVARAEQGGLRLDASSPASLSLELEGRRGHGEARYELTVPRGVALRIEATNVDVSVRGVKGGVHVENMNGDITLADVGGEVAASNMSGPVRIDGVDGELRLEVQSGEITVANGAGLVDIENVSGGVALSAMRARDLKVETLSGDITYEGTVSPDGRYALSAHSGDVELRFPEGASARLDIESYSGEFRSDYPVTMQPAGTRAGRERRFELLVGGGTGPTISIETFSGNIHLARPGARPSDKRTTP